MSTQQQSIPVPARRRYHWGATGVILGVLVFHFPVLLLLRPAPVPTEVQTTKEELKIPLQEQAEEVLLPDISAWESDFDVTISCVPATAEVHDKTRLIYDCTSYLKSIKAASDEEVFEHMNYRIPTDGEKRTHTKVVLFDGSRHDNSVRYSEQRIFDNPSATRQLISRLENHQGTLHADGRLSADSVTRNRIFQEAGPKYPDQPVRKGDRWVQDVEVDPELNDGGVVSAEMEVLGTWQKDDRKFVRLRRSYDFRFQVPLSGPVGIVAKVLGYEPADHGIRKRVYEEYDFDLGNALPIETARISQTYVTRSAESYGVISVVAVHEKLREIVAE